MSIWKSSSGVFREFQSVFLWLWRVYSITAQHLPPQCCHRRTLWDAAQKMEELAVSERLCFFLQPHCYDVNNPTSACSAEDEDPMHSVLLYVQSWRCSKTPHKTSQKCKTSLAFVLYKMTNKSIFVEPHWKLLSMGVQCSKLVQTITFAELWQCSGQCLDAGHSRWPKPLLAMSSAQLDGPRWPLNSPQIQAKPFYVYLAKLAIYMACEQGPFPTCEKEDV